MTVATRDTAGNAGAPPFRTLLQEHLGQDPRSLPVYTDLFDMWEHVVVQVGLNAYLAQPGRRAHEIGPVGSSSGPFDPGFEQLLAEGSPLAGAVQVGAPAKTNLACGVGQSLPCIRRGVVLISQPNGPLAVYIHLQGFPSRQVSVDVVAADQATATAFSQELRRHMDEHIPHRGQVLRLGQDDAHALTLRFVERPRVDDDAVILGPGVLERIEAHTIGIGRQRQRLLRAGRHLKRGLLLWGPPGTGKTHTVKHLTARLTDYTVIQLTGSQLGYVGLAGSLARRLHPAVVILEDVDLIAEDRARPGQAPRRMLFDLLEMMDGLEDDADVATVLTTNRPEVLEAAIAARPGRVDLAVELPLPDGDARRRLIALYAQGLDLQLEDLEAVVCRLEGVTASFIREMLRQAALAVPPTDDDIRVTDAEIHQVLDRLLDPENRLTPLLLGAHPDVPKGIAHGAPGHR